MEVFIAGTKNDVVVGKNADFSQTSAPNGTTSEANGLVLDGQLWIGRTAVNAGGTHIDVHTLTAGSGISITNGPGTITLAINGAVVGETITGDFGSPLSPTGGNWNVLGQQASTIAVMDTIGAGSTLKIEDRTWLTPYVVDTSTTVGLRGTYSTLAAALTAAPSGATILLRSNVTEDVTITKHVTIMGVSPGNRAASGTTLTGKVSIASAIDVEFLDMTHATNSDYFLDVTNSTEGVSYTNCSIIASNHDGMNLHSATPANVYFYECYVNTANTFKLFATDNVLVWFLNCLVDGNATPVASTTSAAAIFIQSSQISIPFATTGTGVVSTSNSKFGSFITPYTDWTYITTAGTGTSYFENCEIYSGSSTAIVIGAGTTVEAYGLVVNSSNAAAISGLGTLKYTPIAFPGSSNAITVTTQTPQYMGQDALYGGLADGGQTRFQNINTANTANSSSFFEVGVAGATADDAYTRYSIDSVRYYAQGIDNSDSDSFKLNTQTSGGTPSSGTNVWKMTTAGQRTMPLQPCFLATNVTADTNAWGNSVAVDLICDTSIFDQGSNYNTGTGVFTAPVTGKYQFFAKVALSSNGGLTSSGAISLVATSRTLILDERAFVTTAPNGFIDLTGSCIVDMAAGDTAKVSINGATAAATKTGTIYGAAGQSFTWFSGVLIC